MLLRSFLLIIVFVCSQIVRSNDFVWYNGKQAISYAMPQSTAPVVKIAIDMFTEDMKQVTGLSPKQSPASQATIRIIQLDKADKKQQKELRGLNIPIDEIAAKKDGFYMAVAGNSTGKQLFVIGRKIVRKRHFAIKSVLLVAALVAMSSILAIAHNYGAALIDDSNRHLVGKGLHGEGQIIGADEEIEVPDEPSDGIWETTARIKSYKNVSISPNSITEFAVSGDAGQYITPEIIFGNNDLVIFEQEDGSGWKLNEGETLMIQATEYEAETNGGNGQGIMYFYICDGEILDGKSEPRKELNQTFELTAEKSGEYYICLLGVSSDPISLKEGKIVIK